MKYHIRGTHHLTKAGVEADEIRALILRRRLQVLVHSYIYYKLATSLVSDQQWQSWANELVMLQKTYPTICERVDYHELFKGFDGTTGFHLHGEGFEIENKANQLIAYHKKREEKMHGGNKSTSNRVVRVRV